MHRQVFIPCEQNNLVPFVVPQEWYGKTVEFIAFPINDTANDKSYSYLQAEKKRQRQLISAGKMEVPALKDDVFTAEQEVDFDKKIAFSDIVQA